MLVTPNKMKYFSYKGGCGICVSRHSKEELTWATDKWFWFKTVILVKN